MGGGASVDRELDDDDDFYSYIECRNETKDFFVADIKGGTANDGTAVILWSRKGGAHQDWMHTREMEIVPECDTDYCLTAEGDKCVMRKRGGAANQKWEIIDVRDRENSILLSNQGRFLNVEGGAGEYGKQLCMVDGRENAEKWGFLENDPLIVNYKRQLDDISRYCGNESIGFASTAAAANGANVVGFGTGIMLDVGIVVAMSKRFAYQFETNARVDKLFSTIWGGIQDSVDVALKTALVDGLMNEAGFKELLFGGDPAEINAFKKAMTDAGRHVGNAVLDEEAKAALKAGKKAAKKVVKAFAKKMASLCMKAAAKAATLLMGEAMVKKMLMKRSGSIAVKEGVSWIPFVGSAISGTIAYVLTMNTANDLINSYRAFYLDSVEKLSTASRIALKTSDPTPLVTALYNAIVEEVRFFLLLYFPSPQSASDAASCVLPLFSLRSFFSSSTAPTSTSYSYS